MKRISCVLGTALLVVLLHSGAQAQNYALTNRAFVQSVQALGMGDVGVAWPSSQTIFFHNPANLGQLDLEAYGAGATMLGVRASLSTDFFEKYDFYFDRIQPFVDADPDLTNAADVDTLEAITRDIRNLGEPGTINADVLLPSFFFMAGPVKLGLGTFVQTTTRLQISSFGGVANVMGVGKGDVMGAATAALNLSELSPSLPELSLGASFRVFERWFSYRNLPVDQLIETDQQRAVLIRGTGWGMDLGLSYNTPLPGLTLGAAVFDVAGREPSYKFYKSVGANFTADDPLSVETLNEAVRRTISMSYRFGASYRIPVEVLDLGLLRNTGVAVEYLGFEEPIIEQPVWSHLHMGVQTTVGSILHLRAGLNQGYTTLGAGLSLGPVQLDYAFYGMEEGRQPGQFPRWNHTAQIRFGF